VDLAGITTAPALDTSIKASGNSSLKFTIDSQSGANGGGAYWTNFSDDLLTQFGAGQSFYVQWRQRFSPEFINTIYLKLGGGKAGGWKQISMTTGDKPSACPPSDLTDGWCQNQINEKKVQLGAYPSCTPIDVPVQNTEQRKYAQMYNSCANSSSHGPYWGIEETVAGDFLLQNARPSPFCTYTQTINGTQFPPTGNCFGYFPNEWMTFKTKLTLGPRGSNHVAGAAPNDVFVNSRIQLWIGREGQPTELAIDVSGFDINAGTTTGDQKFGKIYLLPYHSYKDDTQVTPTAYTWYDDLIISSQNIADPGGSAPPPTMTQPPAAPTGLSLK